ncbi:MAG: DUF4129 domain-containing protein [Patescibacteria group bacterium]|nr:DUF4129 domain-containing protein [Patescibacteria group bacterium]
MTSVVSILICLLPGPLVAVGDWGGGVDWGAAGRPVAATESVHRGRDALSRPWRYPWYDADADTLKRIDVSEEPPPPENRKRRSQSWLPSALQLLGWAGIAVLFGLIAWLIAAAWRMRGQAGRGPVQTHPRIGPDQVEAIPIPGVSAAGTYLDEARRLYEQGDFSRAVVCLFAHELLELDRAHVVRLARGKTNRQYLREIGRRLTLRQLVEQTMVAFEDVFFGNRPLDRTRFEACWKRLPEFDSLIEGGLA